MRLAAVGVTDTVTNGKVERVRGECPALELIGDKHDWAFILGPEGYDAMHKSGEIADQIRDIASVAAVVGFAL